MLTPLDIQNKIFSKEFRGYSMQEVDEFLNSVIDSYEKQYKDNVELRNKIDSLTEQISHYKTMEETLKETLVIAQSTGEKIQRTAGEKAEVIVSDAAVKAKEIIENAHNEVRRLEYKYEEIKRNFGIYCAKMNALIQSQLILVDNIKETDRTLFDITGINQMVEESKKELQGNIIKKEGKKDILKEVMQDEDDKTDEIVSDNTEEFKGFDKLNSEEELEGGFAVTKL